MNLQTQPTTTTSPFYTISSPHHWTASCSSQVRVKLTLGSWDCLSVQARPSWEDVADRWTERPVDVTWMWSGSRHLRSQSWAYHSVTVRRQIKIRDATDPHLGQFFFVFSFVFVFHFLPPEPHLKDVAWYYPYLPLPHTVLLVRVCVSLFILFHTQLRGPQTWVLASPSDGFKQVAHGDSSRETHSPVWELKKKKKKKSWSEVVSACVLAFCVVSILWRSTIFWSASLNPYVKRRTQRNYPEKIMYYVCIFILFDFHMLNNIYL